MKPLNDLARQAADVMARVIAEIGLPNASDALGEVMALPDAIRLLAQAHLELLDRVHALHDLANQTDPNDPIRKALVDVGLTQRPRGMPVASEPRLVPTLTQIEEMPADQLVDLYRHVMGGEIDFAAYATFIVRVWDGMDGCWSDCTGEVDRDEALRYWAGRTDGGTRRVSFKEIDYYRIFPGDTRVQWDGSEGREMHR